MIPIRTILHPTDFSPRSEHAFQLACSLARDHGARLVVLHVFERAMIVYSGVAMAPSPGSPSPEQRQAVRQQLSRIQSPYPEVSVEHRYEEGDPATGILEVAREIGCDLIVMGTHGRTGFARLFIGSVAEKVLREASCPVLTAKLPFPAEGSSSSTLSRELAGALKAPPA